MVDLADALADTPLAAEGYTLALGTSVTTNAYAFDEYQFTVYPGGGINDVTKANFSVATEFLFATTLSETPRAFTSSQFFLPASLQINAHATDAWTPTLSTPLTTLARVTSVFTPQARFNLSSSALARATDSYTLTPLKTVTETASSYDSFSWAYTAGAALTDIAHVHEAYTPLRVVSAALTTVARALDAPAPTFLWVESVTEFAETIEFLDFVGSDTTWAINTRTGAITQYSSNWSFNSFASMGRKYIAANETGLFELDGANDVGAPISATLGSGFTQLNGTKFAGLKGVYLGLNGQGTYQLTLLMGDGRNYVYSRVSNPNLQTTKFIMGKGLHARYIAWELTNAGGQDFDLDTVELVPMVSGRRVG